MKNRILTIQIRPFKPTPTKSPRVIPIVDLTRQELYQRHLAYALDQGNNHQQAVRYAALMAR